MTVQLVARFQSDIYRLHIWVEFFEYAIDEIVRCGAGCMSGSAYTLNRAILGRKYRDTGSTPTRCPHSMTPSQRIGALRPTG